MSETIRVRSLRPLHFRRVVHSVQPAPISRPPLRTGQLECGHPFVDETDRKLIRCSRCAGEALTEGAKLWSDLNEILSRPQEVLPEPEQEEEEPTTRPVIRTRIVEPSCTLPPNEIVACSMCGGRPTPTTCPFCHGTRRKWRYGPRVYPKQRTILFRRPSLEDVERMGFSRPETNMTVERTDDRRIGILARAWARAGKVTERWYWEGELAHHGWLRPPLTKEELLRKYPPTKRLEEKQ